MTFAHGDQLQGQGSYTIWGVLGSGGMGAVYLAGDQDGCLCAVKELAVSHLSEAEREIVEHGFLREAEFLKRVNHPRIPKLIEQIEQDGSVFIVMEFIEGKNLAELVEAGLGGGEAEALRWMRDIVDAVAACHKSGFLHGDIKPENIRIRTRRDAEGGAYLVDFGVAVPLRTSDTTEPGPNLEPLRHAGTALFGAPEKFGRTAEVGAASDVFSIGATFHYVLTGVAPVHHVDRWLRVYQPRTRELNHNVSPELDEILHQCLKLMPDERITLAELQSKTPGSLAPVDGVAAPAPQELTGPVSVNFGNGRGDSISDFAVTLWEHRANNKPVQVTPPQFVAFPSAKSDYLLAAWQQGWLVRLKTSGPAPAKPTTWPAGMSELRGLITYVDGNGQSGCLAYGRKGSDTAITVLPNVCALEKTDPKRLSAPRGCSQVCQISGHTYVLYEHRKEVYFSALNEVTVGEAAVSGDRVPDCRHASAVLVTKPVIYVLGLEEDRSGRIWARHRTGDLLGWQKYQVKLGQPLAINVFKDHIFVVHRIRPDVFVTTLLIGDHRVEGYYSIPGLDSVDSMCFDSHGNLWITGDGQLYRMPLKWLLSNHAR